MRLSVLVLMVLLVASCETTPEKKDVKKDVSTTYDPAEAKQLLTQNCYVCHSPTAPEGSGRIAPPMVAIKAHYLTDDMSKEEFVNSILHFVNNPTEANSKMRGAVRKFGVMPNQKYPEETLRKISEYMYDYQIEEPTWFKDHYQEKGFGKYHQRGRRLPDAGKPMSYKEEGLSYALGTKKVLGKNLMGKIQSEGVEAALTFCNVKAMPLTDSMATKYNATIKRVSDKNRNTENKANTKEVAYITQFKEVLKSGAEAQPIIDEEGDVVHFYYPIVTNSMCLKCHGTPRDIAPKIQRKLAELYPDDKAVGYSENEVRGIWSITFDKN
ncbi:hypothetical protein NBRC110019_05580 [Neptunitalea chrysea]|uniref:Cytochrome c domain-containing protein n=1 Tax=Neptunitalea chrysea TaxID=1647581 RepID=A0A9W6B348_9FLAO|nr:DUF3365 domain-containing protein [Neptunitalea chrysea]GLB51519.1 hypothetical protein NBRC110019_05580 [Neptunitalea chrysea]